MTAFEKRVEELSAMAKTCAAMPDGLTFAEMYLYVSLRKLYADYRAKTINAEQARADKQKLVTSYGQVDLSERACREFYKHVVEIDKLQINKTGCDKCKALLNILEGIPRR